MFIDLLLLTAIICFIIDLSGVTDSIRSLVATLLHTSPSHLKTIKPFECSLCMTFWVGLVYLLSTGSLSIWSLFLLSGLSFMTPVVTSVMLFVRDLLLRLLSIVNDIFKRYEG